MGAWMMSPEVKTALHVSDCTKTLEIDAVSGEKKEVMSCPPGAG